MKLKNIDMEDMLNALAPLLERRDVIGYAAARNARLLSAELTEYMVAKNGLIEEYGEPMVDESGNETGGSSISVDSPRFAEFAEKLEPLAALEADFEPFRIKFESAIGELSGTELLALDWMFEE